MTSSNESSSLFESISNDIVDKGYSIQPYALPENLSNLLLQHIATMPEENFKRAGIGRVKEYTISDSVRMDAISWITNNGDASDAWLKWTASLQDFLNRRLFLGLFSFESHFSHYGKGDFYKKHKDAFKGEENRVLSVVVYLNDNWSDDDGGELILYDNQLLASSDTDTDTDTDTRIVIVTPNLGTIVVFLSEEFPHEVLPAKGDRYSIAGWFRLNNSTAHKIDPPN